MERLVRTTKIAGLAALCATSVAITACGGSGGSGAGSSASSTQPAVAAQHPASAANASNLDIGQGRSQKADHAAQQSPAAAQRSANAGQQSEVAQQPRITKHAGVQKSHATPAQADNDGAPAIRKLNPCTLVPLAQAKAITGGAVTASVEAPLGPTCVYHVAHQKADITLDVEVSSRAAPTHSMSKRQNLTIRGHQAYCGRLGSEMLFVTLPGGKLLHVLAPCQVAQQFAVAALGRLAA